MKKVYIDQDFKCHTQRVAESMEIETGVFDGKCEAYIEGYRFVPKGESWTREDGESFEGEMLAPWRDSRELDGLQREYEKRLLAEYAAALETMGVVL